MSTNLEQIAATLHANYSIVNPTFKNLHTPTNDVIEVISDQGHFALKLYRATTRDEIQWEIDLILHLIANNVPVVRPVPGVDSYVNTFVMDGSEYSGVLFEWVEGQKPNNSADTYRLIGQAAAQIHQAADTFTSPLAHTNYDAYLLIDEQITRMQPALVASGQLQKVTDLTERLRAIIANQKLDYGVCHMDLKPDNVHIDNGRMTVFDFNSSGESWRAIEPYRILKLSDKYFQTWLDGYRSVRPFNKANERAVAAFCIIGDIRSIVWDLGFAKSSRGKPLFRADDLPRIVNKWIEWERSKLNT